MANPPRRRLDPREAAEALFKPAPPKAPIPDTGATELPPARALVSIRLDREVLDHFQEAGPGWQDRINEALRRIVGK